MKPKPGFRPQMMLAGRRAFLADLGMGFTGLALGKCCCATASVGLARRQPGRQPTAIPTSAPKPKA